MAIINEIIVLGRRKRRLINKETKLWGVLSEWTHASDVEFNDGKTAQEKLGSINGITSSFKTGKSDIAASSVLTKSIRDDLDIGKINDKIQLVVIDNETLGWKRPGADTVYPFKGKEDEIVAKIIGLVYSGNTQQKQYTITPDATYSMSIGISHNGDSETIHTYLHSDLIPVWQLDDKDDKQKMLLSTISVVSLMERSGSREGDSSCSGSAYSSFEVYNQNDVKIGNLEGSTITLNTSAVNSPTINVMQLPIDTQYIYVKVHGKVYTSGSSSKRGSASIDYKHIACTYLVN